MFAAKEETRGTELSCGNLLDTINNSKEFGGQIRKYRHRTLISNGISQEEWVDHFDKVFNENTTAQVENAKNYGNLGTMRKATMKFLILI